MRIYSFEHFLEQFFVSSSFLGEAGGECFINELFLIICDETPPSKDLISRLNDEKRIRVIHGDLHPQNIILSNENSYVIDWDMAGIGYDWFDKLTLLTHPELNISIDGRKKLLQKAFQEFDNDEISYMFKSFCLHKKRPIQSFLEFDKSFLNLVKKYDSLLSLWQQYEV